jgi:hypothetical protein
MAVAVRLESRKEKGRKARTRSNAPDTVGVNTSWTPPIGIDRNQDDGRRIYVSKGKRYVEVPLDAGDLHRFLGEIRAEMTPEDFLALIERQRSHIPAATLWRLGLGPMPSGSVVPEREPAKRASRRVRELPWAA